MKHWIAALLALPLASAAHAADCSFAKAEDVLTQPRPEEPNQQIDVLVQQSVEGGSWTVFNGPDGKPNRIIRTDYGEGGRTEYALAGAKANTIVIRKTYFRYSVPYYVSGSAVIREETDYYRFCNSTLDMPAEGGRDEDYIKAAREVSAQFFSAPEISKILIAAGLKPPLWK
jgi:hypothetical protein